MFTPHALQRRSVVAVAVAAALLTCASLTQARVIRIVIDQTLNNPPAVGGAQTVAYKTINGRAFGELCIGLSGLRTTVITVSIWRRVSTSPATRWWCSTWPASRS
jgi:hypothetical protein